MISKLRNCICFFFIFVSCIAWGQRCLPGDFGIAAEWLFAAPSIDHPYFAATLDPGATSEVSTRNRIRIKESWHSGYRVEGFFRPCNCIGDVRVRWTQFPNFSDSRTISEDQILIPIFVPMVFSDLAGDFSKIKMTYNFHYVDAFFGWHLMDCGPFFLTLQGGIQYCYLKFKEQAINQQIGGDFIVQYDLKSRFRGVGPEIGVDFDYFFCNCFTIVGRASCSLLANKRDATSQNFSDTAEGGLSSIGLTSQNYWQLVPFVNLRFGLSLTVPVAVGCWQCSTLDIEVGYEGSWLFNSINQIGNVGRALTDDFLEFNYDNLMSFGLQGPYVHFGIVF